MIPWYYADYEEEPESVEWNPTRAELNAYYAREEALAKANIQFLRGTYGKARPVDTLHSTLTYFKAHQALAGEA